MKLDNEAELREAQAAFFNVNSNSGWLSSNYVGPSTVHFSAGGQGGPDALQPQFEDDKIQYALIRLGEIQEKATGKSTTHDIFSNWVGPGVGIIEKGKKTSLLRDAQAYLQPYHADVTVLNRKNFDLEHLLDKSHPLSGSHVID